MTPAHKALRERTGEAHERVDTAFAGFDLSDRASYAAMLRAHLDALLPNEAMLTRWQDESSLLADWEARRRLPALLADLDALDARPSTLGSVDTNAKPSDPQIAGMLYVVEGSRLGGKFLARQLPGDFPRGYLDSDQPPGKWRELLEKLDPILYERGDLEIAVTAALRVFDAFETAARRWVAKV
jgi:heme oxygenase (biliverdin-IX-beta and delta-forming)